MCLLVFSINKNYGNTMVTFGGGCILAFYPLASGTGEIVMLVVRPTLGRHVNEEII